MTSPYLETPTRSLEQLRDELRARLGQLEYNQPWSDLWASGQDREMADLRVRLAAVEAEINSRAGSA